jgi:hypothetical protein
LLGDPNQEGRTPQGVQHRRQPSLERSRFRLKRLAL